MKICVAQIRSVRGDIQSNIDHHKKLIRLAVSYEAGLIIFPELSLTGYEPKLAKQLATTQSDSRFDDFQKISDDDDITIGVGVPTKNDAGICISMILFQPNKARGVYSKKYIHADEEEFFVSGQNFACLASDKANIALAICYELSIPEHAENAFRNGAKIYIASVAKTGDGVVKAANRLSGIANKYAMIVLMSNCVGQCDSEVCGGNTSVWNSKGILTASLNDTDEGIIVIDTDTEQIITRSVHNET